MNSKKLEVSITSKITIMQNVLTQTTEVAKIGENIGLNLGEEMVKAFYDKHPEIAYANVMGKEMIEKILNQPGCTGIAILPGYNREQVRQSILVGIDDNCKPILSYNIVNTTGELRKENGIVADRTATVMWGESI
jgi:hypothetical protein